MVFSLHVSSWKARRAYPGPRFRPARVRRKVPDKRFAFSGMTRTREQDVDGDPVGWVSRRRNPPCNAGRKPGWWVSLRVGPPYACCLFAPTVTKRNQTTAIVFNKSPIRKHLQIELSSKVIVFGNSGETISFHPINLIRVTCIPLRRERENEHL